VPRNDRFIEKLIVQAQMRLYSEIAINNRRGDSAVREDASAPWAARRRIKPQDLRSSLTAEFERQVLGTCSFENH
jgi:hypothetical protein